MSAAVVPVEYTEAQKTNRLYELWHWLVSMGVCDVCASGWACARVAREMEGEPWRPWPSRCVKKDRHGRTCAQVAKDGAAGVPPLRVKP